MSVPPGNVVGPMITNKNDKLLKALELEKGESWLVPPRFLDKHKYVLAPTVKWGVRPGNYSFRTEKDDLYVSEYFKRAYGL